MMRFRRTVFIIACFVGFVISPAFAQPAGDLAVELSGFSVSEAYDLNAGDALDLSDGQLMKLLFRSEKVSSVNFEKWSQFAAAVSWPQLQESPEQFRFWTFKRKLTLRRLTQIRFPVGVATDELKGVYLAECTYADGGGEQPVFLVTRSAPRKLTLKQTLEQPIAFSGFFYNNVAVKPDGSLLTTVGSNEEDRAGNVPAPGVPLFVAKRFAWFPTGADPAMSVSDGQVELAARGVDVGLFDYVRKQNSKPLSGYDSDAFYQMLAAAHSIQSGDAPQGNDPANSGISFTKLMSAPTSHFGNTVAMSGRLRQCVPIHIVDAERQTQVGLKSYFQVSLFPDLGGRDVVVRTSGEESIKFEQFPVTVCLPQLPEGINAQELEGRAVQMEGHFYRFIKYQSQVSADAQQAGQVSPLVIASHLSVNPVTTTAASVDMLMRILLIVVLGAVATTVAFGIFKDRRKRSRLVAGEGESLPEKIDLSQFEHQIDD